MIGMRVTHQDDVHITQPGICAAGNCRAGVIKDSDAGGVFKQQGSIEEAKLARALPQRCDLDVLAVGYRAPSVRTRAKTIEITHLLFIVLSSRCPTDCVSAIIFFLSHNAI
jgi:hypothetical protein